jgi:hypothetical protein
MTSCTTSADRFDRAFTLGKGDSRVILEMKPAELAYYGAHFAMLTKDHNRIAFHFRLTLPACNGVPRFGKCRPFTNAATGRLYALKLYGPATVAVKNLEREVVDVLPA